METLIYHEYTGEYPDGSYEIRLIADTAEYSPAEYFRHNAVVEQGGLITMTGDMLDDCYLRE